MSYLDRSTKIAELISHIAVVIGLVLASLGYMSEKSAQAERFTVGYAREYNSQSMQAARNRIRSAVRSIESTFSGYRVTNKAIATILAKQIQKDDPPSLGADILMLVDYFNGANTCVESNICSDELFKKLHSSEATSLSCLILPAVDYISLEGGQDELKKGLLHFRIENWHC